MQTLPETPDNIQLMQIPKDMWSKVWPYMLWFDKHAEEAYMKEPAARKDLKEGTIEIFKIEFHLPTYSKVRISAEGKRFGLEGPANGRLYMLTRCHPLYYKSPIIPPKFYCWAKPMYRQLKGIVAFGNHPTKPLQPELVGFMFLKPAEIQLW